DQFSMLQDNELRALSIDAAIAMEHNKALLRRLGYVVIDVPSLLPKRLSNMIYFPTLLNGIVQVGRDRHVHLLLPNYKTTDENEIAVEDIALKTVHQAFGADTDLQLIESTAPAQLQGGLHCLTTSIPLSISLLDRDDEVAKLVRERTSKYEVRHGTPD